MESLPEAVRVYLQCVEHRKRMKAAFDEQDAKYKDRMARVETRVRQWMHDQPRHEIHLEGLSEDDGRQLGASGKLRLVTQSSARALSQQRLDHLMKQIFDEVVRDALKDEYRTPEKVFDLYTLAADFVWKGRETREVTQLKRVYSDRGRGQGAPKRRRTAAVE